MIITAVADKIPGNIKSLVYLDAFLPSDGDSIATLNTAVVVNVILNLAI